jgi:hypothetical protein
MPPKSSKKTVEKEKQKIIEDKTFGLKNKNKSKKVEKYIKSVQSQVANKGVDKVYNLRDGLGICIGKLSFSI